MITPLETHRRKCDVNKYDIEQEHLVYYNGIQECQAAAEQNSE